MYYLPSGIIFVLLGEVHAWVAVEADGRLLSRPAQDLHQLLREQPGIFKLYLSLAAGPFPLRFNILSTCSCIGTDLREDCPGVDKPELR